MRLSIRWGDQSIARKLFTIVGIMAALIAVELATVRFAMRTMSAVRAFVAGEGLWSKAQKNAVFSLERYARTHDERDYQRFFAELEVPAGDHRARVELARPGADLSVVRRGFLAGGIHPDDITPMVDLLRHFHDISYLARAVDIWAQADGLLAQLSREADRFHAAVLASDSDGARVSLEKIDRMNDAMTTLESGFSNALGEGSRWLERAVLFLLTLAVVAAEGVGLTLAVITSRAISRGLADLNETAHRLGRGDFWRVARVRSRDEIGELALSLNEMGKQLHRSHAELEARVHERTAALESLVAENEALARQAQEAVRARDAFISIASHELRNPLAPIVMALDLLDDPHDTAKPREIIARQVRHVVRLVDDLLDVSRITCGRVVLRRERVCLADVITESVEMASPLFTERHHVVAISLADNLYVDGDPVRLAQVVANVLTNAAKYTEPGGHIAITSEVAGDIVTLRVRDSGIGISADMLPHIFDLFVQERQALDRSRGGLGLGLAIVRNLVTLHGGEVNATSAGVGAGTQITICLPSARGRRNHRGQAGGPPRLA